MKYSPAILSRRPETYSLHPSSRKKERETDFFYPLTLSDITIAQPALQKEQRYGVIITVQLSSIITDSPLNSPYKKRYGDD